MSLEKNKWNEHEIKKVAKIILDAEKNKSHLVRFLDEIVHWLVIMVAILGNVIISAFIVSFSGLMGTIGFYLILGLLAVSFGALIDLQLKDIEKLERKKHTFTRWMLPIIAMLNIIILVGVKNAFQLLSGLKIQLNVILAGVLYGLFFLLPHFITSLRKK